MMSRAFSIFILVSLFVSCGPEPALKGGAPDFRNTINSLDEFHTLSEKNVVKYLINLERDEVMPDVCYFLNTKRFALHHDFLVSLPGFENLEFRTYSAWVLDPNNRRFYGSVLRHWEKIAHPDSNQEGIITFGVYSTLAGLTVDDLTAVKTQLTACAAFAKDLFVFVPDGTDQYRWLQQNEKALEDAGIPFLYPNDLITEPFIIHSVGEGYGTLRIVPEGEPLDIYGPRDVVVVSSPPADISLVQGLITRDLQNELSHTNLRLLEKDIPNVSMPDVYNNDDILDFENRLVRFVTTEDGNVFVDRATLKDAEDFWKSKQIDLPDITSDLSVTETGAFTDIRNENADAYGAKAANLGELMSILPAENQNPGFAIPFSAYQQHVQNAGIDLLIETFLDDPQTRTDASFKREELKKIRDAIKDAPLDPFVFQQVQTTAVFVLGSDAETDRLKFRSSTNVEDLDELTGAGLYDSKSGCLADDLDNDELGPSLCLSPAEAADKEQRLSDAIAELAADPSKAYLEDLIDDLDGDLTNEKSAELAVKKVWASLWNERAFDERAYYGIDHRQAFMGIAVNRSFVLEKLNSVALTELRPDEGRPLYRLNSQVGHESVVRPENPTVTAEFSTFRRATEQPYVEEFELLVSSSFSPGVPLWTDAQLEELAALLFLAHTHFADNVYPHLESFSLDVEIKLTSDDRIVLKQARPFIAF